MKKIAESFEIFDKIASNKTVVMKKSKNIISCRKNSSISLMLFIAVILFCSVPFMSSAGNDGQKYRRMQMIQFLKRNIPEYYLTMESDTESVAYDAKSKYGISVEEVYEHYIRQRPQSVRQKTEVYVVKPAENITDDSAGDINTPEFNDAILSRIDTVNLDVVHSETECEDYLFKIYFDVGKSDINENMSGNKDEIARVRSVLSKLMADGNINDYHITITGMCSPEGMFISNLRLAKSRCESVVQYLELPCEAELRNECEGWQMLDDMVAEDSVLTFEQKCEYIDICENADRDLRENIIREKPFYSYFRNTLYPSLRVVFITFNKPSI